MDAHPLKNRAAIVTGGRRGIGRAIALALAGARADVAVCDIVTEDGLLEKTKNEANEFGSRALAFQLDVSVPEQVAKIARSVSEAYGKIDILVNCAGIWIPGDDLIECSLQNWDKVINTNLKGTLLCCQAIGKILAAQKCGSIINLSSQVGLTPGAGTGAYSISKAGIIALTRQLALELAPYRVRVNAIAPGIVKTEFNAAFWKDPAAEAQASRMVPLGRLAEPEDIAGCAVFLASDAAQYVTGEVIAINGGWQPTSSVNRNIHEDS
jgi:NAD(P)-dependent dehydrogenase (short-subunit alcohol dehydrogenase family)